MTDNACGISVLYIKQLLLEAAAFVASRAPASSKNGTDVGLARRLESTAHSIRVDEVSMSTDRALEAELREAALEDAQASWAYPEPRYTSRSALLEKAADALLALSEEVERFKTCGMIEVMVRNPQVDEFVRDKEAELERAYEALRRLCVAVENIHGVEMSGGDLASAHAHACVVLPTPPSSQPGNSEVTR
jgi:hypothetical protein